MMFGSEMSDVQLLLLFERNGFSPPDHLRMSLNSTPACMDYSASTSTRGTKNMLSSFFIKHVQLSTMHCNHHQQFHHSVLFEYPKYREELCMVNLFHNTFLIMMIIVIYLFSVLSCGSWRYLYFCAKE